MKVVTACNACVQVLWQEEESYMQLPQVIRKGVTSRYCFCMIRLAVVTISNGPKRSELLRHDSSRNHLRSAPRHDFPPPLLRCGEELTNTITDAVANTITIGISRHLCSVAVRS